jgi:hypothetical protein
MQNDSIKIQQEDSALYIPCLPLGHAEGELTKVFHEVFWQKCYSQYINTFDVLKTTKNHQVFGMKIQKTKPGQGYHIWHYEASSKDISNRFVTWTIYLNDDFEAGETEFLYQQYRYKPSKGDVVLFPAAFTHTHRGNPPIGGDKYIITGWVEL